MYNIVFLSLIIVVIVLVLLLAYSLCYIAKISDIKMKEIFKKWLK